MGLVEFFSWYFSFLKLIGLKVPESEKEELATGIAGGIAVGIAVGIGAVIGINLVILFTKPLPMPLWILALTIIIIAEMLFLASKKQPTKKENKFHFTIKQKIKTTLLSAFLCSQALVTYANTGLFLKWWNENIAEITQTINWAITAIAMLGIGTIILFTWFKANQAIKYGGKNK